MASSSTTGSTTIASSWEDRHGNFKNRNNPMVMCRCGVEASFSVSWTDKNPGRKFRGCPNYQDPFKYCKFFRWLDPPLPNQEYKNLMYEMHLALVSMGDGNAQLKLMNQDQNRRLMMLMKVVLFMVMLIVVMLAVGIAVLVKF